MGTILLIGTRDTKGRELAFVREILRRRGHRVLLMDVGVFPTDPSTDLTADIDAARVAAAAGADLEELRKRRDRGAAVTALAAGAAVLSRDLFDQGQIDGVMGLGGSGGTTLATAAMRALPVGIPKLMVSTLAAGNVAPYVGVRDITMMYPVTDIAGLNQLSRRVLSNAAAMIAGAVEQRPLPETSERPLIAATMFGVTTPCVTRLQEQLAGRGYDVVVFHATGSGGRAMEGLIADGVFRGVADITTTEWCDELVGGVLSAGPERLDAAARAGTPQVVSVGALDMVNFGPPETVPERFTGRRFYHHNEAVTLMRTTPEENHELGRIVAEKLAGANGPTVVMLPLRGVSMIDAPGQPFYWPEADESLFASLRSHLDRHVKLVELDLHINDPAFADAVANELANLVG